MCLDVLRAVGREREAAREVLAALGREAADLPGARASADFLERAFSAHDAEGQVRPAVERLAMLASVAALRQSAPPEVVKIFAQTRLGPHGALYGSVAIADDDARRLIERALPTD
jgi:putative acyl-CoA dehydrogenase